MTFYVRSVALIFLLPVNTVLLLGQKMKVDLTVKYGLKDGIACLIDEVGGILLRRYNIFI